MYLTGNQADFESMIRILLADNQKIFREKLKDLAETTSDIVVRGEAGNVSELEYHLNRLVFDVLVLDISLPGGNGLDILKWVKKQKPAIHVLIISKHLEKQIGIQAVQSGASGYFSKTSASKEFIVAVRKSSTGEQFMSQAKSEKSIGDYTKDPDQ